MPKHIAYKIMLRREKNDKVVTRTSAYFALKKPRTNCSNCLIRLNSKYDSGGNNCLKEN